MFRSFLKAKASPTSHQARLLAVLALLLGLLAPFASPQTASAAIARGAFVSTSNGIGTALVEISFPPVSEAAVNAGAVLIAQMVAISVEANTQICPTIAGWTEIDRVDNVERDIVQHTWSRAITTPSLSSTTYRFQARISNCGGSPVSTAMTGGLILYTGVDTSSAPVAESTFSATNQLAFDAPTTASLPAGSRVVRFFGARRNDFILPNDASRIYSERSASVSVRAAAAFDSVLADDGPSGTFTASVSSGLTTSWVATTVVLSAGAVDSSPPTTTASATANGGAYAPDSWTRHNVSVSLSASDTGGSGVQAIVYSASGGQTIGSTTVPGASALVTISGQGLTTITYAASDIAGNTETANTFIVKIDKTNPSLAGLATSAPNADGWHNDDVTIDWSCDDLLSGIVSDSCPADSVVSGEGAALSASASVADNAGNQTSASVTGIKIDRTAPITAVSPVPPWSGSALSVTLTPTDNLSGVAATHYRVNGGQQQTGTSVPFSAEGVQTLEYWSEDKAGNAEGARTAEVKVDLTAPTISHTLAPEANANGWHNTPVSVTFECADGLSGVASCSAPGMVTSEGQNQIVTGTATDLAGNSATDPVSVNIDLTAPTISASLTPEANAAGWHNADVTVSFTCLDALSGISACPEAETLTEGANQSVSGDTTDAAGNPASATVANIDIDTSAPTIVATATTEDGQPYTPGVWTSQTVTVTFECDDSLSGIASCPDAQIFGEGASQTAAGAASDMAGNSASATIQPINVDGTAPTISVSLATADGQSYTPGSWTDQPVTVTFACADGQSGINACPAPVTLDEGAGQSVTGTATDAAGYSSSLTIENINIDTSAPSITAVATTADGQPYTPDSWTNQAVTVTFACGDTLSEIASCPGPQVFGEGAGQTANGTALDNAGNSASASIAPINIDTTVPTISASATTADGAPYVSGAWTSQTVTVVFTCNDTPSGLAVDCPAPVVVSASTAIEGQSVAGQVSDLAGNTSASVAILVRIDMDAPVFTFMPGDMTVEAASVDGAVAAWSEPAASDAVDGAIVPLCSHVSGAVFPLGTTTVTCLAAGATGNTATASFNVTVSDTLAPVINVPAGITVTAESAAGSTVTFDVTASDNTGVSTLTCAPASGSLFPVGTTVVTCAATDGSGNVATASFNVQVQTQDAHTLFNSLRAQVARSVPHPYYRTQLTNYLNQAQLRLRVGQPQAAALWLDQFISRVKQYRRTVLPAELADSFIAQAEQIRNALGNGPPPPRR